MATAAPIARNINADLAGMFRNAVEEGVRGSLNGLVALVESIESSFGNPADIAHAHARIGERMQAAILHAYETNVEGRKRVEQRSSPARLRHKLRQALQDPGLITTSVEGIHVDIEQLAHKARHFARLNWGTEGSAVSSTASPSYELRLFNENVGRFSFHAHTRPSFRLPAGLFLGAGGDGDSRWTGPMGERRGTGAFVPFGELPNARVRGRAMALSRGGAFDKPTRGIEPRYFLEAGLAEMVEAVPAEYDSMMQNWLHDSLKAGPGGTFVQHLRVRGGAYRIVNPGVRSLRVKAGHQYR